MQERRPPAILNHVVVVVFAAEYPRAGEKKFAFQPCPGELLRGHFVVAEKADSGKGDGAQNAHPAHRFVSERFLEQEVHGDRDADSDEGAQELAQGKAEKDAFLIPPDFLVDLDFDG